MSVSVTLHSADQAEMDVPALTAADFLLDPDSFVDRCLACNPEAETAMTLVQKVALAEAIRTGRPRIEVADAIRRYTNPSFRILKDASVNGVAKDWSHFIVVDDLIAYAPGDDAAFIEQVYSQALHRSPNAIEAVEAKFDLKGGLSRSQFIAQVSARSPVARLNAPPPPPGVGTKIGSGQKMSFDLIRPSPPDGWIVADDVYLQPAQTVNGMLQLSEGWVLCGPRRSMPAGRWQLSIHIVQPEHAVLDVDVVANAGLDVLTKIHLVGPACSVLALTIEPWHHFIEVRVHKAAEPQTLRQLNVRELLLRQA